MEGKKTSEAVSEIVIDINRTLKCNKDNSKNNSSKNFFNIKE